MARQSKGFDPRRAGARRRPVRSGVLAMLQAAAGLVAANAHAQATCDEFKAALAERIDATGARGYSLDTAPAGTPVPAGAKVIGTCDSGATAILYRRWGAARPAAAAPTRSVPAEPSEPPADTQLPVPVAASAPRPVPRPVSAAKATAPAAGRGSEKSVAGDAGEGAAVRAVDSAVAQLAQIPFDFNPPVEMTLGEPIQVQFAPGTEQALRALERALGGGGPGEAPVAAARQLEAQLSGANFRITALTPKEMTLASAGHTSWQWQLQPTLAGTQALQLTLSAEFLVDGAPAHRAVRTIHTVIVVKVASVPRTSELLSDYWRWLLALLLVPVAGLIWAWRVHRSAYDSAGLPRGPKL
jgi:hypothetical protein